MTRLPVRLRQRLELLGQRRSRPGTARARAAPGFVGDRRVGVDADEVERVPERHVLGLVPVGGVGERPVVDGAQLGDERAPALGIAGGGALELGAEDEQVVAVALGERGVAQDEGAVAGEPLAPGVVVGPDEVALPLAVADPEVRLERDLDAERVGVGDLAAHAVVALAGAVRGGGADLDGVRATP